MSHWSIKKQILTIVLIMAFMALIICGAGIYAMMGIRNNVDEINVAAMRLAAINEVALDISDVIIGVREVIVHEDPAQKLADSQVIEQQTVEIDCKMRDIGAVIRLQTEWQALTAEWEKHKTIVANIIALSMAGNNAEAVEMLATQCNPTRQREGEILAGIIDGQKNFFHEAEASATSNYTRALTVLLLVAGLGIVIGLFLSWLTMNRLSKRLDAMINDLVDSSMELDRVSAEISSASTSLAEASSEQAASLEETSATLEEISSMSKQTADNAERTSQSTGNTLALIDTGGRDLETVRQAMTDISHSSEEIGQIVKAIESIAFQTNLLALNAAVEAARAGEAGQGFAVVADEVRNLALRSAQAAKDTTDLIQTTVQQVNVGTGNVENLTTSFRQIEQGAHEVGGLIAEITSASNEQALGVGQVNNSVTQIDTATQSNASMAEQTASSASTLTEQTLRLKDLVDQLTSVIHGGGGRIPPKNNNNQSDTSRSLINPALPAGFIRA